MKPDGTRRTKKIAVGDGDFKATSRKKFVVSDGDFKATSRKKTTQ